jgi:hypothetical protein
MVEPFFKQPRERDEQHLDFIRQQPCCICGDNTTVEAHHPRVGTINGDNPGMAQKCSDKWALPLCGRHHRELHSKNEMLFWTENGIDPFALAMRYRVP